jgi:hypothetical protein
MLRLECNETISKSHNHTEMESHDDDGMKFESENPQSWLEF